MKKIIMLVILAMTLFSCSIIDEYNEAKREAAERGRKCYKYPSGYVYCEDRYGNREFYCILQRYKIRNDEFI